MRAQVSDTLIANSNVFHRWGGRVPILLGAAGHRDIDTSNALLVDAIRNECVRLRKSYSHSPFVILSSLAEGADRLIARIAMEVLEAELIAVLPMPEAQFERDFQTGKSKAEFREFLRRAVSIRRAAVPDGDTSWTADGEPRNCQYARAGAIVADHAQVLFAIWDGKPARGTGGTANQVEWFERGGTPNDYSLYKETMSLLDPVEPGLLIQIDPVSGGVSPRQCPPTQAGQRDGTQSPIRQILTRMDKYNHDVLRHEPLIAASRPLIPKRTHKTDKYTVTHLTYRASDKLSAHFAKWVRRTDAVIFALALVAVVVFNFVSSKAQAPWIYLGVTFIMAVLAFRIRFWSIDDRFLEYRCIAEAARTLFFWRNAGVKHPLWMAFLARQLGRISVSRQLGTMHWVRQAVRSMEFCQDCSLGEISPTSDGIRLARVYWVDDQTKWLEGKHYWHLRKSEIWKQVSAVAFGASFLTALVIALLTVIPGGHGRSLWVTWVKPENYGDLWEAALAFFAGGGVVARGFLSRMAHLELAKQYASQKYIFESASRMLDKSDAKTAPDILEQLGQEAMAEQAEWLWLRHTHPFEVPAG